MMCALTTMQYLILMQAFGPDFEIIREMCKKMVVFIFILSIIVIPYGFVYHTITEGTEDFKLSVILKSFYKMMWTIFLQIRELVAEVGAYPVQSDGSSIYTVTSTFLFVSLPLYVLSCNILILNLIIAVFAGIVDEMSKEAEKTFRLMRYSNIVEFEHKTILPPPFNLFEFFIRFLSATYRLILVLTKRSFDKNTNFAIKYINIEQDKDLQQFEELKKDEFLTEEHIKQNRNKKDLVEKKIRLIEQKLTLLQTLIVAQSEKAPGKKTDVSILLFLEKVSNSSFWSIDSP